LGKQVLAEIHFSNFNKFDNLPDDKVLIELSFHIGSAKPSIQKVLDDNHADMKCPEFKETDVPYTDQSLLEPLLPNSTAEEPQIEIRSPNEISSRRKYLAVFVFFLINLLNYMDRYTIAG